MRASMAALAMGAVGCTAAVAALFAFADRDDISDGFGRGATVPMTRDCRDIPDSAVPSQGAFEESRDGRRSREILTFFDPENPQGRTPALVVYGDERPSGCPPNLQRLLDGPPPE